MKAVLAALFCLVVLGGTLPARAAEAEISQAQSQALDLPALAQAGSAYAGATGLTPGTGLDDGLGAILDTGTKQLPGALQRAVRSGVVLLAVVMVCALAEDLWPGRRKGGVDVVSVAGALAVTAAAVGDVNSLVGIGRETIENMGFFSNVLLPAVTAAAAAGGAPGQAAARQLATVLFSNVMLSVISRLLVPLVYLYIAASTGYAAMGNEGLRRLGGALKWVVTASLTALVLAFVGYLTVSGAVAGAADAVAVKTAKLAVSGAVPVVGGILSDAAESVLAGAGILRNTIGVFGMLVVLAMCVIPFVQLGVHYLVYKAASAVTATVSQGRVSGLIDSIGGAFGLMLGMTGATALVLLISMVSAISLGGG